MQSVLFIIWHIIPEIILHDTMPKCTVALEMIQRWLHRKMFHHLWNKMMKFPTSNNITWRCCNIAKGVQRKCLSQYLNISCTKGMQLKKYKVVVIVQILKCRQNLKLIILSKVKEFHCFRKFLLLLHIAMY